MCKAKEPGLSCTTFVITGIATEPRIFKCFKHQRRIVARHDKIGLPLTRRLDRAASRERLLHIINGPS